MSFGTTAWCQVGCRLSSGDSAICANEDVNRNGVLESGEDINGDGQLWPRKPDVIVLAAAVEDPSRRHRGAADHVCQGSRHAGSTRCITVSASGVGGTEGRATYLVAPVPVDAASLTNKSIAPAYVRSAPTAISSVARTRSDDRYPRQFAWSACQAAASPPSAECLRGDSAAATSISTTGSSSARVARSPALFERRARVRSGIWKHLSSRSSSTPGASVIATGGGVVLRPANRELLRTRTRCVYLRASNELLWRRLRRDRRRPLLQVADPQERLRELSAEREPLYEETAAIVDRHRRTLARPSRRSR